MTHKGKILIVEDEFIVANDLQQMLQKAGYVVCGIASSVHKARTLLQQQQPDWVLIDIILKGDYSGIDLGNELMQQHIPFLYISANTNQRTLEAAKLTRPHGFLVKPFREKDLFIMLDIARYKLQTEAGQDKSQKPLKAGNTSLQIADTGSHTEETLEKIKIVAPADTSVLITGESGTGKELAARAIHRLSRRSELPMVVVDCAALPVALIETELFGHEKGAFTGAGQRRVGKFEQANQGTIFLDEVGELSPDAQVKLLRVLQEKEVVRIGGDIPVKIDVRVIAATNRQLEKEVAEGRFRLDLYYRLSVFPIELVPLRERKRDIPLLANYFLKKYTEKNKAGVEKITESAMQQLMSYDWPGNIRELEHLIERHVLLATGKDISVFGLPSSNVVPGVEQAGRLKTMDEMERDHILAALRASKGKVSGPGGAAEMLGLPAQTLYSRIKRLGIKQVFK
ncbi:sigma-54 dependent transcriptional regulator [Chitinophaga sp. CF418]|uniref:sigma-54-dependent transcriptional regulator n=1 Tax=Chitinophaga sp. CF418 TaxID=1855287 RepID=UPI00091F30C3|nr:sigma-54 dependent transcriptional regulator [Chitinophaga sp. CF418]SHM78778.1 DNA-binding transcriptional response regulator, NtrC family, contains REC, AAA-type ATPase, and a Fis-type DNA-binding domains [Chitinophaga sp. CF418]